MQFMVLGKNKITQENNIDDNMSKIVSKLIEEFDELIVECNNKNSIGAVQEAFDVIQVIIRLLVHLKKTEKIDIKNENIKHNLKLFSRGWSFERIIKIK